MKTHTYTMRPLSSLIPYARNARTHSDAQVAQLAASIREFGFTSPVVIDEDGGILAGHGRVMALRKLGVDEVPCIEASGLSEAQRRAYVLADNKLALNAGWDEEMLRVELGDLQGLGFDLELTGFGELELQDLMTERTEGLTDPDSSPAVPDNPRSRLGDVWLLGHHRIICGDSTDADVVSQVLGDVKPHLMVTDPPYGVNYDPSWRARFASGGLAVGKVQNDHRSDWREAWALFPGHVAYVWHGALHNVDVAESLIASGFAVRSQIVWVKTRAPISRGNYHWQHEPAFYVEREEDAFDGFSVDHQSLVYSVRVGKSAGWCGGRKQTTVWFIEHLKSDTGHGTQKPVECMKRPIENNSSPGQAIYEPFSGSGTTIIAGEMTGRHVYAIELDPAYVDVAVKRWQEFTGKVATLESTGEAF